MIGILIVSCSENRPVQLRYQAEKTYLQADKYAADTRIRPELNTDANRQEVRRQFGQALQFAYDALDSIDPVIDPVINGELSSIAHRSATRLTQSFFGEKQYDTCASIISQLLTRIRLQHSELIPTTINLGQALQASGRWDSALVVYSKVVEDFYPPVDDAGSPILTLLNLPLHMQHVYAVTKDTVNADIAYEQAEDYYQKLANEYPGSELATAANSNLARLYYDAARWDETIEQMNLLVDSTGKPAMNARLRTADILAGQLKLYDSALVIFDEIQNRLEGRDTLLRPAVLFKKSQIYLDQNEYAVARGLLVEISSKYPQYYDSNPTAQYMKARSFDLEGNWDRAETEYKFLIEQYAESREAMATHLYLARRLGELGRSSESVRWYERSEDYFNNIATRETGTPTEASALTYKADMFRQQERWQEAADVLESIGSKFPKTRLGRDAILTAVAVYRQKLDDTTAADSLIEELRRSYTPDATESDS